MFFAFAAALLTPVPATAAAAPPPAQAADSAVLAEATRLLEQEGFEEAILRSTETALDLMVATMASEIQKRTNEPVPEDFLEQLRQTIRDHALATLRSNMLTIKQRAAAIYAQEFTLQELIRLRELSSDPVMVKARDRAKVIEPKLMVLGASIMKASESELEAKISRLVSEYLARQGNGDDQS